MNVVGLVLRFVVGAGFVALAVGQLVGFARVRDAFANLRIPRSIRWAAGVLELLSGLLMLASIAHPFLAFFAATLLALILAVALIFFVVRGARREGRVAGVLLAAVIAIAVSQPLGLRVLALPKADSLPVEPAPSAKVLKTYPEGTWFESVKPGRDGTIYMTANKGEDFQTGDKSQVIAQVLARSPGGAERVFFELPRATTAGVLAFGGDGTLYMTSDGAARGVWRLSSDGKGTLFARLPEGAWPNGLDVGPDGKLYVADSLLGVIWRVDPQTGAAEKALEHPALRRRAFVALAPGANGIHFLGRDMFVTVSDAGQILEMHLAEDGRVGAPSVVATGIPGDDFAIAPSGALYITTHPYNTLVRVTGDGQRVVVADARQGIIGATDVAFGVEPGDRSTLYVVTDGGAFSSGDPRACGTLVAVTLPADR